MAVAALLSEVPRIWAQDVSVAAVPDPGAVYRYSLAFSKDGQVLREVRLLKSQSDSEVYRVRVVSYDAATGKVRHVFLLQPDTYYLSETTDGRTLLISADRNRDGMPARLFLFDTETEMTQDIPSEWFDSDDHNPYAAISGDGRLVSNYAKSDGDDYEPPIAVHLYDWPTKKQIGYSWMTSTVTGEEFLEGGVTEDGKFGLTSNLSYHVTDPTTGQTLGDFGPHSVRSSDGAWAVEFPKLLYRQYPRSVGCVFPNVHIAPEDVLIKNGMNGKVGGKLDLQMTGEQFNSTWAGAFLWQIRKVHRRSLRRRDSL